MQSFVPLPEAERLYTEPERKMKEGKEGRKKFMKRCRDAFGRGEHVAIRMGRHEKDCKSFPEVKMFINSHQRRHDAKPEIVSL